MGLILAPTPQNHFSSPPNQNIKRLSQANLGSGQPLSRGAELHIPCHSRNTNPSAVETSASFCIQYPDKARDFHYNSGVDQEDDRISLMAPDNDIDGATNEEPPYASVPSMVSESEPGTGSKASSFQARETADLDSLLGKTKAQSTGLKRPSNNDVVSIQSKKSKTGENETATPDLQVDEEILQECVEGMSFVWVTLLPESTDTGKLKVITKQLPIS